MSSHQEMPAGCKLCSLQAEHKESSEETDTDGIF